MFLADVDSAKIADSLLEAKDGLALPLGKVGEIRLSGSALLSDGTVISVGLGGAPSTILIEGSLLLGRKGAVLGVSGSKETDFEINWSVILSGAPAGSAPRNVGLSRVPASFPGSMHRPFSGRPRSV